MAKGPIANPARGNRTGNAKNPPLRPVFAVLGRAAGLVTYELAARPQMCTYRGTVYKRELGLIKRCQQSLVLVRNKRPPACAAQAHNLKVIGSNPIPATKIRR
jgi:hypothetical protein